jgi:four helix bundle protein
MQRTRHHEDLRVWKAAMDLAKNIYRFTLKLPKVEQYGLAAQLRNASTSIAANLAEGAARARRATLLDSFRWLRDR